MEKAWDLRVRTKAFAVEAVQLGERFPSTETGRIIQRQFIRSATSVAANYRAAKLARSRAEFAAKIQIALEEADESMFWLELIAETGLLKEERVQEMHAESHELASILMSTLKTVRGISTTRT